MTPPLLRDTTSGAGGNAAGSGQPPAHRDLSAASINRIALPRATPVSAPHICRHNAAHSPRPGTSTPRTLRERVCPCPKTDPPTLVRTHWSTALILALYLPLIIIPWTIVCILDVKPLVPHGRAYDESWGEYTPSDLAWVPRWVRASNILGCLGAALAFPVTTTVLAHASVALAQKVRPGQKLNARELLSLADGCWMRVAGDRKTWLATAGTAFIVLAMAVPLLQISAIHMEHISIAACNDVPNPKYRNPACHKAMNFGYTVAGYDPEPADMALTPGNLVARRVRDQLPTLSNLDRMEHIWPNKAELGQNWAMDVGDALYYYQKTSTKPIPFYVSAFGQDFNTGVLREHAIRLNSTASCEVVPRSDFPHICPGGQPLAAEFKSKETQHRFCVPGNYSQTPWTISRNRQDITEEMWVDSYVPDGSAIGEDSSLSMSTVANQTVHCTATTTRGYFELPNNHNDGQAGSLLEQWPSQRVLEEEFDDVDKISTSPRPPAEENPHSETDILIFRYGADPFGAYKQGTPGPLTLLVNAMLGNESWFFQVRNATTAQQERDALVSTCLRGLPFSSYAYLRNGFRSANLQCSFLNLPGKVSSVDPQSYGNDTAQNRTSASREAAGDVSRMVAEWFSGFGYSSSTEEAIEAGMYLANEALLVMTADASRINSARPIYRSDGTSVMKPSVHSAAKAVISFLVLVEVVGLAALAVFIYRVPTFASRFDALHVAAIGAQLVGHKGLELPLGLGGFAREKYMRELESRDGLIGSQEEVELAWLSPRTSVTLTPAASLHRDSRASPVSASRLGEDVLDPDAPPKYGDIVQADTRRPAVPPRKRLVVGGPGRVTRGMAKKGPRSARTGASSTARGRGSSLGLETSRSTRTV